MRTFHKFSAIVVIVDEFVKDPSIKTTQFLLLCSDKVQKACLLFTWSIKSVSLADLIPEPLEKYTTIALEGWLMSVSSARLFYNLV